MKAIYIPQSATEWMSPTISFTTIETTSFVTIQNSIAMRTRSPRILILGGTSEASRLATILWDRNLSVISSLAGRVIRPALPPGVVRIGGFGGIDGLTTYLEQEAIQVVIDVTHPFASRMSCNAEVACRTLNIPLISFERPPWKPHRDDHWLHVPDMRSAALLVDTNYSRVFLSIGRQELDVFSGCRQAWFLVRSIDKPENMMPPRSKLILERGPFNLDAERQLLRDESIDVVVSKNSGATATYPKIEAARELDIPIVMIDRPQKHSTPTLESLDDVMLKLADFI